MKISKSTIKNKAKDIIANKNFDKNSIVNKIKSVDKKKIKNKIGKKGA